MFCNEKMKIENKAATSPITLNSNSVIDAMNTPNMIGIKEKYTLVVCFSPNITRERTTTNKGIDAFTEKK